jgi:hypothetical protein
LPSEQLDEFNSHLDQLLTTFSNLSIPSIILTDSNLNLLKLKENPATESYFNTVHSNGFLFVQNKATRQNIDNMALIDHIFTIHKLSNISSGVIIEDLSDHFPNFIQIPITMTKTKIKNLFSRSFNATNTINFHNNLNNVGWNDVYACNDVNLAFDIFWDKFNTQFNISFPETKTKPNRNFYKINDYMTSGLLTSRRSKILLYQLSITDPSPHNIFKYKTYRNLYNSLVRLSKKMYFTTNLELHKRNPKKTWDLLREATTGTKPNSNITQIKNGDLILDESSDIAEKFNEFFTTAGNRIANSIPPSNIGPLSYINLTNHPLTWNSIT